MHPSQYNVDRVIPWKRFLIIVISLLKKSEDGKIELSKLKHDCRKKWFSDPGSFEETIAVLEEKNYIVVQEKGHEKAGRPSKVVFINPKIYDT